LKPEEDRAQEKSPARNPVVPLSESSTSIAALAPQDYAAKLESARASSAMKGERRVVTILFCDLKGSTAAAEQLDPEEWAEIMNGAFEYMIHPIYRYEGTVARLMGDAILAFFGAPLAHEDDPQRAIHAGLEIVNRVQPYRQQVAAEWGVDFDVRVGINTGLVVVGEVGSDLRMEYTAMGDAINLAARMEQTAIPGTVQVSAKTHSLVSPLFDFEDLGEIQVKGKSEPVKTFRPLRRKAEVGRLRGIKGLGSGLVGRQQEKEALVGALENLDAGTGGIVSLLGEAGLGKSRLIRELKSLSEAVPGRRTWVETLSLSYETEQPYGLFRRLLRRVIGADLEDGPDRLREKIGRAVHSVQAEHRVQMQRVFESLFGLGGADGDPPLEGETFSGLLSTMTAAWWRQQAELKPVILICDDLHWSDTASIGLLQHLFSVSSQHALLLVLALRPDRAAPGWKASERAAQDHPQIHTEIYLQPLSTVESGELVDDLLRIADLPNALLARIQEKGAGNPYFVEEIVRSLIDKGLVIQEGDGARWRTTGEVSDLEIPGNLQTLLIARIDRLAAEARRMLQVASVVGRSFYYRLLLHVVDNPEVELDQSLQVLEHAQLIEEAARVPELEYLFRHALTQEAAYNTILLKDRRAFHLAVGEALETLFPDQRDELAPQLALHFSRARQAGKVLEYATRAGDNAYRLYALEDAVAHFELAQEWAERGEASGAQLSQLYLQHGRALELLFRWDDALAVYQELEDLGVTSGQAALRLAAITAQAAFYYAGRTDWEMAQQRAREGLVLANQLGDRAAEAQSFWVLLMALSWTDPEQALHYGDQGLAIARELARLPSAAQKDQEILALLLIDSVPPLGAAGEIRLAQERAAEGMQVAEKIGNLPMVTTGATFVSWAQAAEGRLVDAQDELERAVTINKSIANEGGVLSVYNAMLFTLSALGDFARIFATIEAARPISEREGRFPVMLYELYEVVPSYWLGGIEWVHNNLDRLQSIEGLLPFIPQFYLSCAALAFIAAGEYQLGAQALAAIEEPESESYLGDAYPNIIQIKAELARAAGEEDRALELVDSFILKAREKGALMWLPQKQLLKAELHERAGDLDQAYEALHEAHALAAKQQSRLILWQVCAQLADLEHSRGNLAAAQALIREARTTIAFIADHAGREALRDSFLAQPRVQGLLADQGVEHD
jgi:predicted ATPase/class 3 adenylate cyclase